MTDWLGLYAGHDAAAAYVRNGWLVAATEEERITGQKHHIGDPVGARLDVLQLGRAGDYKTIAATPHLDKLRIAPDEVVDHHLAHAAYAYTTSGFERAKVAVVDGGGDRLWAAIYDCEPGQISAITETLMINGGCPFGQLYGRVTEALGFRVLHDEGKVMGMAGYGESAAFDDLFYDAYLIDGQYIYANTEYDWNKMLSVVRSNIDLLNRAKIAAALQNYFVKTALAWIKASVTPDDKLCVAGGVFANVKLNQELLKICERLYVAPAMNDGGLAAGAALYAGGLEPKAQSSVFLGYDLGQIDASPRYIAETLAQNKLVALARGRMEYGPRALGNRSILAQPAYNTDQLNRLLGRDEFMPFAPVIMSDYAASILEGYTGLSNQPSARHMTLSYNVRPEWQDQLKAVVHVDGTARPQVIDASSGIYYEILKEYYILTGIPALINTSLNVHNSPIARTAEQARYTADYIKAELFTEQ